MLDAFNRLQSAFYSEPLSVVPQIGSYNETVSYDLNGNISTLQRNRYLENFGVQQMDNLAYVYTKGNQLDTVTDSSANYFGYPDTSGNLIHYDLNSNMSDHIDKGILQIGYNHLNLPHYIKYNQFVLRNDPFLGGSFTQYVNTSFLYRADGVKVGKVHSYFSGRNQNDASLTTEYLDGFQYNFDFMSVGAPINPQGLQFVPTSEGYYDFQQNKYIYQYKDQVGNIRLSFYKNALGNTVIDRTNDYYPFGLEFGGSSSLNTYGSVSPNYTYSFQGQEKQQETGWNSFKWRNYDPAMGRFFNIDPLSEKYQYNSTYAFQENKIGLGRELEGLKLLQERGMIVTTGMTQYDVYTRYPIPSYVSSYTLKPNTPDPQLMDTDELPSGARGMGKWNDSDGSFSSFAGEAKATKALGIFEVIKLANTAMDGIEGMNKTGDYVKAVKYIGKLTFEFEQMKNALETVNKADLKLDNKTKTEITNYVFDGSLPKDIDTRNNSVVNLGSKSNIVNTGNSIMRKNGIIVHNSPEVKKRTELDEATRQQQEKLQNSGQ